MWSEIHLHRSWFICLIKANIMQCTLAQCTHTNQSMIWSCCYCCWKLESLVSIHVYLLFSIEMSESVARPFVLCESARFGIIQWTFLSHPPKSCIMRAGDVNACSASSVLNISLKMENGKFDFCFDFKFVWCTMSIELNQVSSSQFLFIKWYSWHRQFVHIMSKLVISQIQCAYKCSRLCTEDDCWLSLSLSISHAHTMCILNSKIGFICMNVTASVTYTLTQCPARLISKLR